MIFFLFDGLEAIFNIFIDRNTGSVWIISI